MKSIFTISLFLITFFGFSQANKSIVFGLNKSSSNSVLNNQKVDNHKEFKNVELSFRNYEMNVGIQFRNKLQVLVELAFMNISDRYSYNDKRESNMKTVKAGLNVNYRFLQNRILSPKIGISGGFFPFSDIIDQPVNTWTFVQYSNSKAYTGYNYYKFNSWQGYADLDVLASLRIDNFNIDFGGVLNYQSYKLIRYDYFVQESRNNDFGLGFKISITYDIPFSK